MNVRKPVDYSAMFEALDTLLAADLPQMELYCEIGRLVSNRTEKGTAVAAAEYLRVVCPDVSGFSPRNLRRMREFYRTYESVPEVLAEAMTIGWTQNVVILEAELSLRERAWYIQAVRQFGWSKLELQRKIAVNAHMEISLDFKDGVCYTEKKTTDTNNALAEVQDQEGVVTAAGNRIVCFGDSNTYGYDPRSYLGGRYPETVRWTALLKTAGWEIVNKGENGRCIPQQRYDIDRLLQSVHRTKAEVVVIMLGSNDLLQWPVPTAETCAERMDHFLTVLLGKVSAFCKILLITPPPMKLGAWVNDSETLEESHRLAGCYKALAQRLEISFADAGGWDVELAFDGVHFSEAGHRAFADGIQKVLERLVLSATNECCQ